MIRKPAVILLALSLALLALSLLPAAGLAAKGGVAGKPGGGDGGNGGGGNGGGGTPTATVSASPNPAAAYGDRVEVSGCGYDMYQPAEMRIVHPDGFTESYMVSVWNPGCLNPTTFLTTGPGSYRIEMYQSSKRATVLVASTTLTAV